MGILMYKHIRKGAFSFLFLDILLIQNFWSNSSIFPIFSIYIPRALCNCFPLTNTFKQHKELETEIHRFCNNHKLDLHIWKTKTQKNNSSNCGFQIIFYLFHFVKNGLKGMYRLQSMLQQYSLATKEYYVLKRAYKICK